MTAVPLFREICRINDNPQYYLPWCCLCVPVQIHFSELSPMTSKYAAEQGAYELR